jgi:phosphoglycolate phosphatase
MRYKHIIWDWNGTLFDDAWLCVSIINGMLGRRKLATLSPQTYETIFDFPVKDYYERAGFDFLQEPFEVLSDEFMGSYWQRQTECGLRPGARAVLAALQERGITQSILSAMLQDNLDTLVDHFKLRGFFTDVVGIDNHHAAGKLDVARRWLAAQTIPPQEMLFVGDTTHDHEVAQALGVDCVQIHSGHHAHDRLAASGARLLETLDELLT